MSITPRGMSIQEAYRIYREGNLLVNRKYQRKLVWTIEEKRSLIDSIIKGYPIPLILLAERPAIYGSGKYEIIDGMQRLNGIFSFIENTFSVDNRYFDVSEFARAKQLADSGIFIAAHNEQQRISPKECADFLDYQLAVTIYPTTEEKEVTEVFRRINANGKHLSDQELRQAGKVTNFTETVRRIAAELRGDVSKEILLLTEMPEISIESKRSRQGYNLSAENIFWCKQGVLSVSQLRDSEDEQIIADISASILLDEPLAVSRELLDRIYDPEDEMSEKMERLLNVYNSILLSENIKTVFSIMKETIEAFSLEQNIFRKTVSRGSNPTKTPFYTVFMAFFDLIIKEEKTPFDYAGIMTAINHLSDKLHINAHYTKKDDRVSNIDLTKGLIQRFFVKKDPPILRHGPGLALDLENSLRRSKIETNRYEMKQGLLRLYGDRKVDTDLIKTMIETICGIANLGPESNGYLFIGVADKQKDAVRIEQLDKITTVDINGRYVVGIDRELVVLGKSMDEYIDILTSAIKKSNLSDPLKSQVLTQFDTILFRNLSVIRITIPAQKDVSFVGEAIYTREGSSTIEATGKKAHSVSRLFS